ncbi:MAG: HAD hydrolase-like protein [Candidatus Pacebacteria bacterium]|nr:HAD hydrolase-like protein [Candidatus Paceibacterota bacterium]
MNHQAFLFDFDGVLCKGRFYEGSLLYKYSEAYDWIQKSIFSNHDLVGKWMRGIINSDDINKIIFENTETDYNLLKELYEESVRKMKLEEEVLDLAKSLKNSGAKIGIVTDNMDVFFQITVRNHNLDNLFDVIINSADHGILKRDDNGRLFDIALDNLGEKIENSLMIDDSMSTIELYKQKGGQGFLYKSLSGLESFLK